MYGEVSSVLSYHVFACKKHLCITGGIYESDAFYRIADDLGIMIWQDFMFACSMYQANDVFLASVTQEVKHQVGKMKIHFLLTIHLIFRSEDCKVTPR